jgi:pSer/pThr/pTyr-binding forkhead associated (FHA) protein
MRGIAERGQRTTRRFVALHGSSVIPLRPGEGYLIGRSSEARIVLHDHMVSRRHARLIVGQSVVIEDLGSANGVFVDGKRISASCQLRPGQRVQIGRQELKLREAIGNPRAALNTLPDPRAIPEAVSSGQTDQLDFAGVLLELGARMLADGRAHEAEQLLEAYLTDQLSRWKNGKAEDSKQAALCAEQALALAAATGNASWLDYVFELYAAMDELLPDELINESYRVVRLVRRPSLHVIRAYVGRVEAWQRALGPSERFLLNRLHGLERMAKAR